MVTQFFSRTETLEADRTICVSMSRQETSFFDTLGSYFKISTLRVSKPYSAYNVVRYHMLTSRCMLSNNY